MAQRHGADWGLAAALAVAVACTFDPTRTCQTSADCVNGATCDPGTGTCVQSGSGVVLRLTLGSPPARTNSGPLMLLDPGLGGDAGAAFRRDESTTVTVTSNAANLDAGSVRVTLTGVGPGAAPMSMGPLVPCAAPSSAFCLEGTLSFGPPVPLEAFRGVMQVTASGSDTSGNPATPAVQGVPVTRWKWSLQLGGPIRTSPAVGATGRIYVGTDSPDGRFHAVTSEGTFAWAQPLDGGAFVASATVGAGGAGETVYVASAETGHCAALAVSGA
ncbi:MAG TPA: PQQ-binding-like beta-propeller repeat protein, partial [Myxococcaceae bacterium]|nr:PQQ-binding-like beta-propeller repeat protein [Myxococcaceae bacterium]